MAAVVPPMVPTMMLVGFLLGLAVTSWRNLAIVGVASLVASVAWGVVVVNATDGDAHPAIAFGLAVPNLVVGGAFGVALVQMARAGRWLWYR